AYRGAQGVPADEPNQVAGIIEIEDDERQIVVATHYDCRRVHYAQLVGQDLIVREAAVANGIRILHRIGRIDAVDLRRLDQHIRADLDRAQARRGIRREERIAGTGGEDHDPPLLEVPDRAAANVILADLVDLQRGHRAGGDAAPLERILQRERIDDRREHAHVIGRHAIHAGLGKPRAAKDVAAADHETD